LPGIDEDSWCGKAEAVRRKIECSYLDLDRRTAMTPTTIDGEMVARFAQMLIGNPLLDEAHSLLDDLRYCGVPGNLLLECFL
jgi:hypothetical protein